MWSSWPWHSTFQLCKSGIKWRRVSIKLKIVRRPFRETWCFPVSALYGIVTLIFDIWPQKLVLELHVACYNLPIYFELSVELVTSAGPVVRWASQLRANAATIAVPFISELRAWSRTEEARSKHSIKRRQYLTAVRGRQALSVCHCMQRLRQRRRQLCLCQSPRSHPPLCRSQTIVV